MGIRLDTEQDLDLWQSTRFLQKQRDARISSMVEDLNDDQALIIDYGEDDGSIIKSGINESLRKMYAFPVNVTKIELADRYALIDVQDATEETAEWLPSAEANAMIGRKLALVYRLGVAQVDSLSVRDYLRKDEDGVYTGLFELTPILLCRLANLITVGNVSNIGLKPNSIP